MSICDVRFDIVTGSKKKHSGETGVVISSVLWRIFILHLPQRELRVLCTFQNQVPIIAL